MTGILDMSWEDDAEIKSNEQNNLAINLRWASTSTVAVVTATTGPGQRGRTVYFRLWLSSCSQGGPLQGGVPTRISHLYPNTNFFHIRCPKFERGEFTEVRPMSEV